MKTRLVALLSFVTTIVIVTAQEPSPQSSPASVAPAKIPLRDFFKNPESRGYLLSPDGKTISYLAPWESRMNIWVRPTGGGEAKRVSSEKERDIREYFWKGNDFLLYAQDTKGDENFHLFRVNLKTNEIKDLTPYEKVRVNLIDDLEGISSTDILLEHNKRNKELFDAYRLNVTSGALQMAAQNPGHVDHWVDDHDGKILAATETDGVNATLLTRADEKSPFKKVLTTNFREHLGVQFFTFDNKQLYAASNIGRDKQAIVTIDPTTGKETGMIYQNPDVDVDSLAFSKKRKVLTYVTYTTWKEERKYLDPKTEEMFAAVEHKLPGYQVEEAGNDRDENQFIFAATSDRTPGSRHLFNTQTGELTKLAEVAPWLKQDQLASMKAIEYTSRDGLTIHGYLTLPLGRDPKNLPIVINPHGGPWARDNWGYDPEVQFLANRGYGILQMNFRGSTGYGRKFWEASFKEWGKKMQDDITDGVQWLIKQGIADPKRIAIYGGSYGGYATLAGVTFTPDLYAAAVDYVGPSNMFTFMKTIPPYWKPYLDMFHEMVGDPVKDKELLESESPVMHVDKIKTPLFVAQGAQDPRVNKAESDQMVASLKKRGVIVEYMVKDNEGHGFHNEENKFDFYGAMERFLDQHLHPDTAGGSSAASAGSH
jgi:dipeptidyl aminopeptidase/acylaminoacyl peptidase